MGPEKLSIKKQTVRDHYKILTFCMEQGSLLYFPDTMDSQGADQTVQMHRLVYAIVVTMLYVGFSRVEAHPYSLDRTFHCSRTQSRDIHEGFCQTLAPLSF